MAMFAPPRIAFTSGTVEALKWFALVLMTGDHVNKHLIKPYVPELLWAGRLAMPIFMVVLAYNLSRHGAFESGIYSRTFRRLAVFGVIASVPYIALSERQPVWLPLNILFTLLATAATIYYIERAKRSVDDIGRHANWMLAIGTFVVIGALVEYRWPALIFGVAAWRYFSHPSWFALAATIVAWISLQVINLNHWALAAIPLLYLASRIDVPVPRWRWAFYVYYPLHLFLIWLVSFFCGGPLFIR